MYPAAMLALVYITYTNVYAIRNQLFACKCCILCTTSSYSCWLSTDLGTIFAFVAPMLAILIVSGRSTGHDCAMYHNTAPCKLPVRALHCR